MLHVHVHVHVNVNVSVNVNVPYLTLPDVAHGQLPSNGLAHGGGVQRYPNICLAHICLLALRLLTAE